MKIKANKLKEVTMVGKNCCMDRQTNRIPEPTADCDFDWGYIHIKEVNQKPRKMHNVVSPLPLLKQDLILCSADSDLRSSSIRVHLFSHMAAWCRARIIISSVKIGWDSVVQICPNPAFSLFSKHIYKSRKRYHGNTLPGNLSGLAWCPIVARALLSMAIGWCRQCVCKCMSYICL